MLKFMIPKCKKSLFAIAFQNFLSNITSLLWLSSLNILETFCVKVADFQVGISFSTDKPAQRIFLRTQILSDSHSTFRSLFSHCRRRSTFLLEQSISYRLALNPRKLIVIHRGINNIGDGFSEELTKQILSR